MAMAHSAKPQRTLGMTDTGRMELLPVRCIWG